MDKGTKLGITSSVPAEITVGTETQRGFINDNVFHSAEYGEIHYSSYIPESYDGTKPYALFITLPGYEGLYFQGVGANMVEDFGVEAFIDHYNIDKRKVYLHGYSGGGETGSLIMGIRPELYTAYLETSSQWDGDLEVLAKAKTPVYLATGENDSYYGSQPLKNAYKKLRGIYESQGLTETEIDKNLVLDVKDQAYFTERGYTDQHGGGMAFAHDETIMNWLFKNDST